VKYTFVTMLTTLVLMNSAFGAMPALAQAKKPGVPAGGRNPMPKPIPKPDAGKSPIVLGTNQLPGDFGQFGQTYTIGKHSPLNFTLTGAEYVSGRYNAGDTTYVPTDAEKLLVLHYTVHNPTPDKQDFDWGSVRFTVVDRKDINHESKPVVVREGTSETVNMALKPAQKLDVQTVIVVPADGVTPKLIVLREEGAAVIRYDLRGKVKPLAAPFMDTTDTTGATARKLVPAQPGVFYPLGEYDVRLDSVAYTTTALGNGEEAEAPGDGKRYVTLLFTVRNAATSAYDYQWGTFQPELKDADGEKYEFKNQILKATKNDAAQGNLKPGEEVRIRYFYAIGNDATAKTFSLNRWVGNDTTHTLVFDVSSLPAK
jgi:hypothetical protein